MSVLIAMSALLTFCRHAGTPGPQWDEEPLLLPEGEADEEGSAQAAGPVADNSRCYVCHMNFEEDKFTVTHARADVGCEQCHGACDAHCEDEDNITPPDKMFPKSMVNPFCMECHDRNRLLEHKAHKPLFDRTAPPERQYCTQCHGKDHLIAHRTRRWNKTTGELIQDDKVRMLRDKTPE